MNNVLIMTHGGMADGLLDSVRMISGDHDGVASLSFRPDWSLDTLVAAIKERLDEFEAANPGAPTLVLVDLFGGTPSNAIATLLGEGRELYALAGASLPMALEAVLGRDDDTPMDAYVAQVLEAGREGTLDIRALLLDEG